MITERSIFYWVAKDGFLSSFILATFSGSAHTPVADLGEGPRGPAPPPPFFVEYLQKIYKKVTEMSNQKPF